MRIARFLKPGCVWIALLLCWAPSGAQQVFAKFSYPDTVCLGAPITLVNESTGATTYNWDFCGHYTDTLNNSIIGCPGYTIPTSTAENPPAYAYTVPGVYSACLIVDSQLVTKTRICYNIVVKRAPGITFAADTFFCAGGTVTLIAPDSPGVQNTWSPGGNAGQIEVGTPGTYSLQTEYYGCSASQTTTVSQLANPTIELPRDTVFCDSGVLRYTTTQPVTYIWNTGSSMDSARVKSSGLYWLQLNERGCTALDTVICKVIPTDSLTLGKDTSFCGPGLLKYVSADSVNVTYRWSTGSDSTSTPVPSTGAYSLTLTDDGCVSMAAVQCTVIGKPSVALPVDTVLCDSGVLRYASPLPVTYAWSTGATTDSIKITSSGRYTLTLDNSGCTAVGSTQATVAATPTVILPADTTFCGPGILQYVSPLPVTYTWSTGSTTAQTPVSATGIYQLQVSNQGCTAQGSTQATVLPVPLVNLGEDTAVCLAKTYILNAGNPGDTYLWQDGSTNQTYTVTRPGTYAVTVTRSGCSASASVRIDSTGVPYVSLGGNLPICPGEAIDLKPSPDSAGYTYTWQDGSIDTVYRVTVPGTYSVTATDACTSYTATVKVGAGVCVVHTPSAFTPNGDGINDIFRVLGTEVVDQFSLQIYNRWGLKVFETEDKDAGWDGTEGGKIQPVGTYVYQLHFRYLLTGQLYDQEGTLLIIR